MTGQLVPRDDVVVQGMYPRLLDYAKGKTHNAVAIGTGATNSVALTTAGYNRLAVVAELAATTTPADLTVTVTPFLDDGATAAFGPMVASGSPTVTSDGTNVWVSQLYELAGIDKVNVNAKNANAGSKTATVSYFLQR